MKGHFLWIWATVLMLFSACSKEDSENLFPDYASVQALSSDVTLSLLEQTNTDADTIQAEEEGLYLYIETLEIYPYSNYGILRSTFQINDTLLIRLEDIVKPSVSLSPAAPASTTVRIPENLRHIMFLKGRETDHFDLAIENDAFILQPIHTSFTSSEHIIYLRETETGE
ncbi:MAG: hypothetical protein PHG27_12700 [Massilibacteroides sp.]|nr:hypothetical protein [Massilibacteroides sp.]MDD4116422.1 hypothetical protein [Massilibacteroides sp.]MDD4660123.1 hypothetical protein [Massilibacteroides sp.]